MESVDLALTSSALALTTAKYSSAWLNSHEFFSYHYLDLARRSHGSENHFLDDKM